MGKSPDAFRTISEVSEWLDTPAHVLRFWESKFTQIKPVKRAGGRRYYRPEDMELLGGIKALLHDEGMTIKGVQRLLRQEGVKHVASLGMTLSNDDDIEAVALPVDETPKVEAAAPAPEPDATPEAETVEAAPSQAAEVTPKQPRKVERIVDERQIDMFSDTSNVVPLTPKALEPEPAQATTIPKDPEDDDINAPARFFRVYRGATRDGIKAKAKEIAPHLDRLQTILDRINQDQR